VGVKSILDIELNSADFSRYAELFYKYQKALGKMPDMWKAINKEAAGAGKGFQSMTAAIMAQNHLAQGVSETQKKQNANLTLSERLWTSMAAASKSVASNIVNATRSLLSWSTAVGAIGGLLGIGSLFGIGSLASNASNQRRSSMGLGMSIGEQKAFQVNFQRLVDPDAYLGFVNQIETDPTKAWSAYALGVKPTGNTETDAVALLQALRAKAQATPTNQLGLLTGQYGLSGVSTEDLRRLKSMSGGEFNQLISGNQRDVAALGISDPIAKGWQDFTTQLQRAGSEIFKTLVLGLTPLEKPLEHLSGAATKFLETLLKSDLVKDAITNLSHWLENFSGKISTPEFLKSVETFTSDIGVLGQAIHAVAHPLDSATPWASSLGGKATDLFHPDDKYYTSTGLQEARGYLSNVDKANKLIPGTMAWLWQQESSSSFNPPNSKAGAIGPFQLMPNTAKAFGSDNPKDFFESGDASGRYLESLEKYYHGNVEKALAAYNWGPDNVDRDIRLHRNDWLRFAPKETQNYISSAQKAGITVNINENTGGSTHTTVSALAP
jgi:Transglycosylase SLT domain